MMKIINKKSIYIILSLFMFSLSVTYIDAFVHPAYFLKIPIKILFFLVLPLFYFVINKESFEDFKKLFLFRKKGLLLSIFLGIGIYIVIVGGFFVTRDVFDYSSVTKNLTEGMGITRENYIYVALYISFMNSFLEEFFFRGFGFVLLKKYTCRVFAYVFSPILFAVYHVGMTATMFEPILLILVMTGLFSGGLIFNYLNEKNQNIYSSWFTHMFANFAMNTIGFVLFGTL